LQVTCSASKDSAGNSSEGIRENGLSSKEEIENSILESTLEVSKDERLDPVANAKSSKRNASAVEDVTVPARGISETADNCSDNNHNNNTRGENGQGCDIPSIDDCIEHAEIKDDSIKQEIKEENDDESFDIIADPNEVDKL